MNYSPKTCVWEVTMGCNMRCHHCGSSCENALPGELTSEEAFKVIDMCADMGLKWISLSGGEPFTRNDILKLVEHIQNHGILINIITNGWLITDEIVDKLKKIRGLRIAISLDGLQKVHDEIRKTGAFEHVKSAIRSLVKRKISVGCITTITSKNIDYLKDIRDFIISEGIDSWQIQLGLPMGNLLRHCDWIIKPWDINRIIDFCHETSKEGKINIYPADCIGYYNKKEEEIYKKSFGTSYSLQWEGCSAGIRSFGILHNGDVLGCTSIRSKEFIEGNLKERTLREIWENPHSFSWRRNFKKENLKGYCLKCKYADKCLGGCPNTRLSMNGNICSENVYCTYNLMMKSLKNYIGSEYMVMLDNNGLSKVVGGRANPVSGLSYEEAMKIAKELGTSRKDMGTWTRMNEKDYMKWWRSSNEESEEYLTHKQEVDDFIGVDVD